MSQERKIDDKDLKKVTGGGSGPIDLAQRPTTDPPAPGGQKNPPNPGNPLADGFEADADNIPGQGPTHFGQ